MLSRFKTINTQKHQWPIRGKAVSSPQTIQPLLIVELAIDVHIDAAVADGNRVNTVRGPRVRPKVKAAVQQRVIALEPIVDETSCIERRGDPRRRPAAPQVRRHD